MLKFDHCAFRVASGQVELVVEMFVERLGFHVLRRTERSAWLRQDGASVDLQLVGSMTPPDVQDKRFSQISFVSETPERDLEALARWLGGRGHTSRVSAYSPREFYLDAPRLFVDFVVEAMTPEMADYRGGSEMPPRNRQAKGEK